MAMYDFCAACGVTTKNYGKLIVAVDDEQVPTLEALKAKGDANNVPGLEVISGATLDKKRTTAKTTNQYGQ